MGNETSQFFEDNEDRDANLNSTCDPNSNSTCDTNWDDTCNNYLEIEYFIRFSLIPSAFIILVLSCLERRAKRCCFDEKCPILSGYFGVITPLDSNVYSNRWSLGCAFGVTANKVMFLFDKDYIPDFLPNWAVVFWVIMTAIEVGFSMYPCFACLSSRYPIVGAVFGFLYTLAWLVITILDIMQCPDEDTVGGYSEVIVLWPSLVCYFFLLGKFIFIFVKGVRDHLGLESMREENYLLEDHQAQHVQLLLRKPPLQQPQKSWIKSKLYEWDSNFKFPSRMISTAVLVIICLYMFATYEYIFFYWAFFALHSVVSYLNIYMFADGSPDSMEISSAIQEFASVLEGVWKFSMFASCFTCLIYIAHLLVCYRTQIRLLRAGKKILFLSDDFKVSPSHSVVSSGKFISWQIAFMIWGFVIMQLVMVVFGMVIMYIAILPMIHGRWKELLDKWGTVILSLAIVMIIKKLQVFLAGIFFLQPKLLPKDKQRPLALDNRKAFVNFSYFLFFHSVVVGFTSSLMRLLRSIVIGTWLIGRVDRPVMPKGFETCDNGFNTWVQMLFLDHYHTNPVLVCFCHLLDTQNQEKQSWKATSNFTINEMKRTGYRVSCRARTRWLLFYTLLNNPSLQKFRKPRSDPQSVDSLQNFSDSLCI
ncbi:stimulated by retinoic acid gene 6 protein-like [Anolis carolinensis]|uniref:stimulated by retinoic acid gene 6 protein-like n=1 Tax=Anolis carolinensis TaxID=28377 RepID=UPI002F2B1BC8